MKPSAFAEFALQLLDMALRLVVVGIVMAVAATSAPAATTEAESTWDRYAGTRKLASHPSRAACVAAVPTPGTQQCRVRVTVTKTADAPPPPPPAVTWTECAREGGTCTFTGRREVRYSAVAPNTRVVTRVGEGSVACVDYTFGDDLHSTFENVCSYSSATTTAPVTARKPPVEPPPPPPPPPVEPPPAPPPSGAAAGPRVSTFTPSGAIVATAGQVISGLAISNPGGDCVRVTVPNVTIRDSRIGPCGRAAVVVTGGAANTTIEYASVTGAGMGVYADGASNLTVRKVVFNSLTRIGEKYAHATEVSHVAGGLIEGNEYLGSFPNDVLSGYESSDIQYLNNLFDISQLDEPTGAAFTMGDSTTGNPGRNNYVAGNIVRRQVGGVPAGVFGSAGNTVLERNCFTAGIQAYNYSGVFVGVTVRNNVINLANSFVPDTSAIAGWASNINGTDCSKVPQ